MLDWLEAASLFAAEEVSQTHVVDHLVQEQIFDEQDRAANLVLSAWTAIQQRLAWMGSRAPITFRERMMIRQVDWRDVPAHSYCLVVSLGPQYQCWHETFGSDYNAQGRLFELITRAALVAPFAGWQFLETGWRQDNTSKLADVIDDLIATIAERKGNTEDYLDKDAKDAGVDLVWYRPFPDSRGGTPIYLSQCASGENWIHKLNEPNIREWMKIVDFAAPPSKAFSVPFALSERELRCQSNRIGGLMVDRYRLLAQDSAESEWIPDSLHDDLVEWLEPRIAWITSR